MGRVNKTIDGVFTDIVGTPEKISRYDRFISQGSDIQKPSTDLRKYTNQYVKLVNGVKNKLQNLAELEEIIMQMRIKENIQDVKLTVLREYIYARCTFYRTNTSTKDIRVLVGTMDMFGENINKLYKNKEFMNLVKEKLTVAMNKEIEFNIKKLTK